MEWLFFLLLAVIVLLFIVGFRYEKQKKPINQLYTELSRAKSEYGTTPEFLAIEKYIKRLINDNKKDINNDLESNDFKPEQFIYSEICNISAALAASGHYHIYRGMLSPVGEELFKVYKFGINKLIGLGFITKELASTKVHILLENINEVG